MRGIAGCRCVRETRLLAIPWDGTGGDGGVRAVGEANTVGGTCHVGRHRDGRPSADDDDAEEGKVPIAAEGAEGGAVELMQTPHDPEVTYSGHKGKGYEVQVSETCEEENAVQVITHVEVTPSSGATPV